MLMHRKFFISFSFLVSFLTFSVSIAEEEEIYLKASAVKAIDTTGAGDAFYGGLAFGLSKEKPIKECLELANKVAGISTTKLGAGDAMPFLKDIN